LLFLVNLPCGTDDTEEVGAFDDDETKATDEVGALDADETEEDWASSV
jgi:hypothetical protein